MASNNATADFLQTFADSAEFVVFAYDIPAQKFTYLNPAFEKLWLQSRKSVLDHPAALLEAIHPDDQPHVRDTYQELLKGFLISEIEFRIQLRKKIERWVCVKPRLLEDQRIIGYAQDITSQKNYVDVLKKFSDKKNAVLNILSHDLAGPLANIQTLARVLDQDLKSNKDYQQVQEMISIITRSSKQGTQLIQDFLKQEFLESANVDLIKTRVDLVARIKETMEEYRASPLLTQLNIRFVTSSDTIYLYLDDNKFMQAINNLMSNAIKFTPDGGQITISLEDKEETVLLQIADNGIGIPEKYQGALFEKFTRARRPGIKGEPSVGLGMSIIKTIVEWHHGQIWLESAENKGTTFFIEVPKNQ